MLFEKINEKCFNVNGSKYHVTKSYLKQALGKHTIYSRRVWKKHEFTATNKHYLANNYSVIPQKFSEIFFPNLRSSKAQRNNFTTTVKIELKLPNST